MERLFNFQPLFFFNTERLFKSDNQDDLRYEQGLAFDHQAEIRAQAAGRQYPEWISNMFFHDIDRLIQVPYRYPGLGVQSQVTDTALYNKKSAIANMFNQQKSPLEGAAQSLEQSMFSSRIQVPKLDADAGMLVHQIARQTMLSAGLQKSLYSQANGDPLRSRNDIINGEANGSSVYAIGGSVIPEAQDTLAKIFPYMQTNADLLNIVNFSNGFKINNQPGNLPLPELLRDQHGITKMDWALPIELALKAPDKNDRRQLLYDYVGRQIRKGHKLPLKHRHFYASMLKDKEWPHPQRYIYGARNRAVSRFTMVNDDDIPLDI